MKQGALFVFLVHFLVLFIVTTTGCTPQRRIVRDCQPLGQGYHDCEVAQ